MDSNPTYYNPLLQGDSGALKRALYKAMGFTDDALGKPLVAVVSSYTNANPGHANLNLLQDRAPRSRVTDYRVPAKLHGVYIDPDDLLCAWRGKSLNGHGPRQPVRRPPAMLSEAE